MNNEVPDPEHPIDYYKESIRLYYYNIVLHQHVEIYCETGGTSDIGEK
jgi:hypothetical protein